MIQWTAQESREHSQTHKRTRPFSKTLPTPQVGGLTTYVQWEFKISMNHLEPYNSYSSHFEWEVFILTLRHHSLFNMWEQIRRPTKRTKTQEASFVPGPDLDQRTGS